MFITIFGAKIQNVNKQLTQPKNGNKQVTKRKQTAVKKSKLNLARFARKIMHLFWRENSNKIFVTDMIIQSTLRHHASPTTYAPGMTNVTATPLVAASTRPRPSCPQLQAW